ncbi:MAG: hypothetical protein Tsb0014_11600 [Pleurocapsa sp.]
MMEIDKQLEILINDANKYGVPSIVIERAIAPVLKIFSDRLQFQEYYILQNLEDEWVLNVINNPQSRQEKTVIYAFSTVKDAANFQGKSNPSLLAAPILVTHLLFRLFSLQQVDSIIFLDTPGNLNQGIEITRDRLSTLIKQQIQQLSNTPPNIA